jgi:hypothetical protein
LPVANSLSPCRAAGNCPDEDTTGCDADADGGIDSIGGLNTTIETLIA